MPNITFVDDQDNVIGSGSKTEALSKGIIHRIVRIFLFDSSGKLLIQKRSPYVSLPNKWDQSAAGHVDEGEGYYSAALRELKEEVGVSDIKLQQVAKLYTTEDNETIIKKRFNMLYVGNYDGAVLINEEVSRTKWVDTETIEDWMAKSPDDFTQGFIKCYYHFITHGR